MRWRRLQLANGLRYPPGRQRSPNGVDRNAWHPRARRPPGIEPLAPRELIDPRSALSGEPLEWKKSSHAFFLLSKHAEFLKAQIADPKFMNQGPATQLQQFFEKGLTDWDITRDGPYFGFSR